MSRRGLEGAGLPGWAGCGLRAASWLGAAPGAAAAGLAALLSCAHSHARAICVGCRERWFLPPGGAAGVSGWGVSLARGLCPRITGEVKGTLLLSDCVAPPRSLVYFCQNGLPAQESTAKMSPFTLVERSFSIACVGLEAPLSWNSCLFCLGCVRKKRPLLLE